MLICHIVFILLPSYYYSQWLLLIKSISFYPIHHNNKYQLSIIIHKSLLLCFLLAILRSIFFLFSFIETRDKNAYLACIPFCTGPVTKRIQNKRLKTITQYVYSFAIAIQSSVRIFFGRMLHQKPFVYFTPRKPTAPCLFVHAPVSVHFNEAHMFMSAFCIRPVHYVYLYVCLIPRQS